jgi:hypothetical protein
MMGYSSLNLIDFFSIDEVVDDDDELKTFYCSLMLNGTILLCTSSTRTHLVVYTSSKNISSGRRLAIGLDGRSSGWAVCNQQA